MNVEKSIKESIFFCKIMIDVRASLKKYYRIVLYYGENYLCNVLLLLSYHHC